MIYIFDIDGTIADISHRLHFIKQEPADWRAFFAACVDDEPINDVIALARDLRDCGHVIVIITGRSDECLNATLLWLRKHNFPTPGKVPFMRKAGDYRPDHLVKSELLDQLITEWFVPNYYKIAGVFEDRKQVVDMYRARGLRVFQVADGDF